MKLEKEAPAWAVAKQRTVVAPMGLKRTKGQHGRPGSIFKMWGPAQHYIYKTSQDSAAQVHQDATWLERKKQK